METESSRLQQNLLEVVIEAAPKTTKEDSLLRENNWCLRSLQGGFPSWSKSTEKHYLYPSCSQSRPWGGIRTAILSSYRRHHSSLIIDRYSNGHGLRNPCPDWQRQSTEITSPGSLSISNSREQRPQAETTGTSLLPISQQSPCAPRWSTKSSRVKLIVG